MPSISLSGSTNLVETSLLYLSEKKLSRISEAPDDIPKLPLFHPLSRRLHLLLMLLVGFFAIVAMRINMGIAITCMVNSTAITMMELSKRVDGGDVLLGTLLLDNDSLPLLPDGGSSETFGKCARGDKGDAAVNDYGGTLVWGPDVQGWLFSSIFYGSMITILPGGYLADTQSPKMLASIAALMYIIGTALTPVLALHGGWVSLFVCRVFMGFGDGIIVPSINKLVSFWIPLEEKSTAATIYTSGFPLASILGVPTFAFFCSTAIGWPLIYYVSSTFGFAWLIVWIVFGAKCPQECKKMTELERNYLMSKPELKQRHKKQKLHMPLGKILTSLPVWSLLVASFSLNITVTFVQAYQPTFFKEVLFLSPLSNGIFGAVPPTLEIFFKFLWSVWMDRMKANKTLSPSAACKISQAFSGGIVAILFVLLGYLPDCEHPLVTMFLFCGVSMSLSTTASGFFTSMLSIAPLFTGLISSATMMAGITGRVLTPLLVSYFNKTGTLAEWRPIFLIIAVTTAVTTIFFVIFASGDVQEWAKVDTHQTKEELEQMRKENEVEVSSLAAEMLN